MKTIKAFIFDVDGVLVDSVPYHFMAWRQMFRSEGINFTFDDYISRVNGLPRIAGIRSMLPSISDDKANKLASIKQQYFVSMVKKEHPKPLGGVTKFLSFLKHNKYKIAAASSSKNAPVILEKADLSCYFDKIISGHDFTKSKPDPEIFLTASNKMGVDPETCVVVEDAAAGIQAGINAGMKTIGVLTSNDIEIKKIATVTLNSLVEYKKTLQALGVATQ